MKQISGGSSAIELNDVQVTHIDSGSGQPFDSVSTANSGSPSPGPTYNGGLGSSAYLRMPGFDKEMERAS
jgi:hypothetical protein